MRMVRNKLTDPHAKITEAVISDCEELVNQSICFNLMVEFLIPPDCEDALGDVVVGGLGAKFRLQSTARTIDRVIETNYYIF